MNLTFRLFACALAGAGLVATAPGVGVVLTAVAVLGAAAVVYADAGELPEGMVDCLIAAAAGGAAVSLTVRVHAMLAGVAL